MRATSAVRAERGCPCPQHRPNERRAALRRAHPRGGPFYPREEVQSTLDYWKIEV